jgi:hypothetical protein
MKNRERKIRNVIRHKADIHSVCEGNQHDALCFLTGSEEDSALAISDGPELCHHKPKERTMDELVKLVSDKAGISADQANTAVNTVLGFLKEKLPPPVASQIDGLLAGGAGATDQISSAVSGLGGLFGQK